MGAVRVSWQIGFLVVLLGCQGGEGPTNGAMAVESPGSRYGWIDLASALDPHPDDARAMRRGALSSAIEALSETRLRTRGDEWTRDHGRLSIEVPAVSTEGLNLIRIVLRADEGRDVILRWRPEQEATFPPAMSLRVGIVADGTVRTYEVNLGGGSNRAMLGRAASQMPDRIGGLALEGAEGVELIELSLLAGPSRDRVLWERVRLGVDDHAKLAGVSREVVAGYEAAVSLTVPSGSRFVSGLGVMKPAPSSPVVFRVWFDSHGESRLLAEKMLLPSDRPSDRGWVGLDVDLADLAGASGSLRLQSGHDGDSRTDPWRGGLWANPGIETSTDGPLPPSVVLISIDTLRPDRLGAYGSSRVTSPQLDRWLGRGGMVAGDAISPAPWTLPAHVSLFTGLDPPSHGVETGSSTFSSRHRTLAEAFRGAGYRTLAVTGGGEPGPGVGVRPGVRGVRGHSGNEGGAELVLAMAGSAGSAAPLLLLPYRRSARHLRPEGALHRPAGVLGGDHRREPGDHPVGQR